LLCEGLCHEWGLCLITVRDSSGLGSIDICLIFAALSRTPAFSPNLHSDRPDFPRKLQSNHRQACRRFCEALLARLLIF
ncbi:hypothetical protein B0H16DRAFT_1307460, partial [Mycena metata]